MPVASPALGSAPGLDSPGRAEVDAPAAEFAAVVPDWSPIDHIDVARRADGGASASPVHDDREEVARRCGIEALCKRRHHRRHPEAVDRADGPDPAGLRSDGPGVFANDAMGTSSVSPSDAAIFFAAASELPVPVK